MTAPFREHLAFAPSGCTALIDGGSLILGDCRFFFVTKMVTHRAEVPRNVKQSVSTYHRGSDLHTTGAHRCVPEVL